MQLSYLILLGWILALGLVALGTAWYRAYSGKRKTCPRVRFALNEDIFLARCAAFGLSARETAVLQLILSGYSYREIGEKFFISEKTVDSHMQHIYGKVGVRNKLALLHKLYSV